MKTNRIRVAAVGAALIAAMFGGQITKAATTFPGSITITAPRAQSFNAGTLAVRWTYRTGTYVKSTSTVDAAFSPDGIFWYSIGSSLPIRWTGVLWVTKTESAALPDGHYALRLTVHGTSIRSIVSPFTIDNTPPEAHITQPAPTDVAVDDQNVGASALGTSPRFAIGVTTLAARAEDSGSGVVSIDWKLDGACGTPDGLELGTGDTVSFDFSAAVHDGTVDPGQHDLTVCATDGAGNVGSDSVRIIVLPGTGAATTPPTLPDPGVTPPAVPDPTACAADPTTCLPELPSAPGAPDPGVTPPATPDCAADPTVCVPTAPELPAPPQP